MQAYNRGKNHDQGGLLVDSRGDDPGDRVYGESIRRTVRRQLGNFRNLVGINILVRLNP